MVPPMIRAMILGVYIPLPGITSLLRITSSTALSISLPMAGIIRSLLRIIRSLVGIPTSGMTLIGLPLMTVRIFTHPLGLPRAPLRAGALWCPLVRVPPFIVLARGGGCAQRLGETGAA